MSPNKHSVRQAAVLLYLVHQGRHVKVHMHVAGVEEAKEAARHDAAHAAVLVASFFDLRSNEFHDTLHDPDDGYDERAKCN